MFLQIDHNIYQVAATFFSFKAFFFMYVGSKEIVTNFFIGSDEETEMFFFSFSPTHTHTHAVSFFSYLPSRQIILALCVR